MRKTTTHFAPTSKIEFLSSHLSTLKNGFTLMILAFFFLGNSIPSSAQCLLYEDEEIFSDYGGVEFNGELYYVGFQRNPSTGLELWKTDGTPGGTTMVKDINATSSNKSSEPVSMTVFNGALYFFADDGIHGHELWKTDGTQAGTELVIDLNVGSNYSNAVSVDNSYPDDPYPYLNVLNGELLIFATDGILGTELWKTDGTAAGTVLVKDIISGPTGSRPNYLAHYNGEVYFTIDTGPFNDLWKTNGTAAGTVLVKEDIQTSRYILNDSHATVEYNGELYFAARDQSYNSSLWKTDGTTSGTEIVKDINPNSGNDNLSYLTLFDGKIFFSANDGVNGTELWSSDGTAGGTQFLTNIAPGSEQSFPRDLIVLNNELLFTATDGYNSGTLGEELWKTDGTPGGTVLVKDIFPGYGQYGPNGSRPIDFVNLNGELVFRASSDNGFLWKTDGTESGTVAIMDYAPDYSGGSRPFFGLDRIFFSVRNSTVYPAVQSLYVFSNIDSDNDGIDAACDACPNDADNDADGDGVCGDVDNCPTDANPGQEDVDSDGIGDACDVCPNDASNDADGDGVCGDVDNCPNDANLGQEDVDNDGLGDACDDMFSVCDALDFIEDEVTALSLPNNTEGFLLNKLAQASTKFQQGNINAANGKLGAFINKVNAKTPSQISASQAAALIALANLIIDEMTSGNTDCSPSGGENLSAPNIIGAASLHPKNIESFELFPNPANLEVNIYLPELKDIPTQVLIYNHLGQLMYEKQTEQTILRIDISDRQFSNGIYTVVIEQAGESSTKRLVVVK